MNLLSTLKQLISRMDEGLVIFDQKGGILHASYDLELLLDEKNWANKSIFDFIDDSSNKIRSEIAQINGSKYVDLKARIKKENSFIPVRIRMASWKVDESNILFLASLVDATIIEKKRRDLLRKALTIEHLSKSSKIREGKLHDAVYEILEMSCRAVNASRVNAWLFNEDHSYIESIGNYDIRKGKTIPQEQLNVLEMPTYFHLFKKQKIIISEHAQQAIETQELNESYLKPNHIISLMDIPIRSEGEIIGVVCFEQVDERHWSLNDQKFGLIAAQMVTLAIETHKRKMIQQELELALKRQQFLLNESNQRIASSLKIASKLMTIQVGKAKDSYHKELMEVNAQRLESILMLHEQLSYKSDDLRVSLEVYFKKLIDNLKNGLLSKHNSLQLLMSCEPCTVKSTLALALGIIINEAVSNTVKHAYSPDERGIIRVDFITKGTKGKLSIVDLGKGMTGEKSSNGNGLDIIKGMADILKAELTINGNGGMKIELIFKLN